MVVFCRTLKSEASSEILKFSKERKGSSLSYVFVHIIEIIFLFLNIKDEPLENRDY